MKDATKLRVVIDQRKNVKGHRIVNRLVFSENDRVRLHKVLFIDVLEKLCVINDLFAHRFFVHWR